MKGKAWFEKLKRQGKIENEEFNKFLESFPDLEIPDLFVNLFEENFLTRERAETDPKIHKKIKGEVLNGVDAQLKNISDILNVEDQDLINAEDNSFKKIEIIRNAIPKLVEKSSKVDHSADEKVKQLEKNNTELLGKIKDIQTDSEKKISTLNREFEAKEKGWKLDYALNNKINGFTFADEFDEDLKKAIIEGVILDVKGKNHLTLNESGEIVVNELLVNPTDVPKPKFNGNDQVTIDSLLTGKLDKFVKKNNANDANTQRTTQQARKVAPVDVDPSQMTLRQMRQAKA